MRILLSAYACKPGQGSEEGNGWGWATNLAARGLEVHVLTVGSGRQKIEADASTKELPSLSFSFIEPSRIKTPYGRGLHYAAWQFAAVATAKALHKEKPFDIVHHVTYGSIHVPTQLWRLGIPVIFGPVGGGQTSPVRLLSYFGRSSMKELFRTFHTKLLRLSPLHHWWYRQINYVFASNSETLALARQFGSRNASVSTDPGLPDDFFVSTPRQFLESSAPIRLLWVGRMLPRKALPLTLDGLMKVKAPVTLTILGDGIPANIVRQMIRERGLEGRVEWSGARVPWVEVREAYRTHDAFLFTSLRDSCAAQLLEAMACGLPIITLDLHGGGSLVPDEAGLKIPVTNKRDTILAIGRAVDDFASSSITERNRMSREGWETAQNFSWTVRAQKAEQLYKQIKALHVSKRSSRLWSRIQDNEEIAAI